MSLYYSQENIREASRQSNLNNTEKDIVNIMKFGYIDEYIQDFSYNGLHFVYHKIDNTDLNYVGWVFINPHIDNQDFSNCVWDVDRHLTNEFNNKIRWRMH